MLAPILSMCLFSSIVFTVIWCRESTRVSILTTVAAIRGRKLVKRSSFIHSVSGHSVTGHPSGQLATSQPTSLQPSSQNVPVEPRRKSLASMIMPQRRSVGSVIMPQRRSVGSLIMPPLEKKSFVSVPSSDMTSPSDLSDTSSYTSTGSSAAD
ncbi:uncharacterized protein LOC131938848 [Physella acuta]|uniref:uncharacterized protein LOC131938848 n=1 Tax=Physella acuta TaxID=109671 RepID=UPI0027DC1BEF|nr:uncharacterized protein LOC131938848 [Physella acuta]